MVTMGVDKPDAIFPQSYLAKGNMYNIGTTEQPSHYESQTIQSQYHPMQSEI